MKKNVNSNQSVATRTNTRRRSFVRALLIVFSLFCTLAFAENDTAEMTCIKGCVVKELSSISVFDAPFKQHHTENIKEHAFIEFSTCNQFLLIIDSRTNTYKICDVNSGKCVQKFKSPAAILKTKYRDLFVGMNLFSSQSKYDAVDTMYLGQYVKPNYAMVTSLIDGKLNLYDRLTDTLAFEIRPEGVDQLQCAVSTDYYALCCLKYQDDAVVSFFDRARPDAVHKRYVFSPYEQYTQIVNSWFVDTQYFGIQLQKTTTTNPDLVFLSSTQVTSDCIVFDIASGDSVFHVQFSPCEPVATSLISNNGKYWAVMYNNRIHIFEIKMQTDKVGP